MSEVVAAGEAMCLLLADDERSLRRTSRLRIDVAGSESNVAVGLARLGHSVSFIGRVGADALGDRVRGALRAEGIDVSSLTSDSDHRTGVLIRDHAIEGRRTTVAYYRDSSAGAALQPADLRPESLVDARFVFISGITPMLSTSCFAFTELLFDEATRSGTKVVFDPNVRLRLVGAPRWRSELPRFLAAADVVMAGVEELELLGWRSDGLDLLDAGVETVIVKRGADGATVISAGGRHDVASRNSHVIDAIGAGDAFAAGWIAGILRGETPLAAAQFAMRIAAGAIGAIGDTAGLPVWDELAGDAPGVTR